MKADFKIKDKITLNQNKSYQNVYNNTQLLSKANDQCKSESRDGVLYMIFLELLYPGGHFAEYVTSFPFIGNTNIINTLYTTV